MKFKRLFQILIDFFETEKIDYALIGAFALHAYGYTRASQDIDLIVRYTDQNKIIEHLESIGFETVNRSDGYSNHFHEQSNISSVDFVYVKGDTADTIFSSTKRRLILGDLRLPVVHPEHLVALKIFAIKNDPERAFREMADINYLLDLTEIDHKKIKSYFEKYGQMERYDDIIRNKTKK